MRQLVRRADATPRGSWVLPSEVQEELTRLRRENAELKRANAMSKNASVYFARRDEPAQKGLAALRQKLSEPFVRVGLIVLVIGSSVGLAVMKGAGFDSPLAVALVAILALSFLVLSIVDFRASVAIAIFELVLGGAGGRWAIYGASVITGRIFLDALVAFRAVSIIFTDWRQGLRSALGRYGAHALVLAFLIPAIWMSLGLINGNGVHDVFSDGNGFVFFAFALVVIALVRHGSGAWFRNVLFAACAANGIVTLLLVVASVSNLVTLESLRLVLQTRFDMGGIIGTMPNGAYRLFTGASLFLQVGLALAAWRLLTQPRRHWLWLLYAVLWIDLVATYTRGLWVGGAATIALVLALGSPTLKRGLTVSGVTATGFAIAMIATPLAGFSLTDYILTRAMTTASASDKTFPSAIVDRGFERGGGWRLVDSGTRSLRSRRVVSEHRSGSRSLELVNSAREDDYVFQNLSLKPSTTYTASAWVDSRAASSPVASRGLFVLDAQGGLIYDAALGRSKSGWRRLSASFKMKPRARDIQIRLYGPPGRVFWDDVRLAKGIRGSRMTTPVAVTPQLLLNAGSGGDPAGQASNAYRVREAKSLLRHIRKHPVLGSGFGAVAADFGTGYAYELSYLDLLFKAGIVGLLLFLSFPLRLIWDALRMRFGKGSELAEETPQSASIVVAVVVGILLAGMSNPYLFAAFGLTSILAMTAWLEHPPRLEAVSEKDR